MYLKQNDLQNYNIEKIFKDLDVDKVEKYFKKFSKLKNDTDLFYNILYTRKFAEIDY